MANIMVLILGYLLVGFLIVAGSDPNPEDSKTQRRILFFTIWLLWPYVLIRIVIRMVIYSLGWSLKRWFR